MGRWEGWRSWDCRIVVGVRGSVRQLEEAEAAGETLNGFAVEQVAADLETAVAVALGSMIVEGSIAEMFESWVARLHIAAEALSHIWLPCSSPCRIRHRRAEASSLDRRPSLEQPVQPDCMPLAQPAVLEAEIRQPLMPA